MKILVVRIRKGSVNVNGDTISSAGEGLALFVGIEKTDTEDVFNSLAEKIVNLRVFENENGKLHYSVKDKDLQVLCIPNLSLHSQ